jgi:hypothetical protein
MAFLDQMLSSRTYQWHMSFPSPVPTQCVSTRFSQLLLIEQADQLKWCIDPTYHAGRGAAHTRAAAVSDLSNVMLLCENIKDSFSNLGFFVDTFRHQPRACLLNSMWTRAEIPDDDEADFILGAAFPHPPRYSQQLRETTARILPPISTVSLFIHMISALHASCTIPELDVEDKNDRQELDPIIAWINDSSAADQPLFRDLLEMSDAPLQNGCQSSMEDSTSATTSASDTKRRPRLRLS